MSAELTVDAAPGDTLPAHCALLRDLDARPAVSLDRVLSTAALSTRHDTKYLVRLDDLPALVGWDTPAEPRRPGDALQRPLLRRMVGAMLLLRYTVNAR